MYAKIEITGTVEVKTGMHIGGSSAFAAIGAVDSPVIKDVRSGLPMIPGSSLKGKIRTLLARQYNTDIADKPDDDAACLTRLFGCAKQSQDGRVKRSRILVSDMFLLNEGELREQGLQVMTEVKFENAINRATAVANPRQIERTIRGSKFGLENRGGYADSGRGDAPASIRLSGRTWFEGIWQGSFLSGGSGCCGWRSG